jgi:hypothetical protein
VIGANFFGNIPGLGTGRFLPQRAQRSRRIRQHIVLLLLSAALTRDGVLVVFSISFRK